MYVCIQAGSSSIAASSPSLPFHPNHSCNAPHCTLLMLQAGSVALVLAHQQKQNQPPRSQSSSSVEYVNQFITYTSSLFCSSQPAPAERTNERQTSSFFNPLPTFPSPPSSAYTAYYLPLPPCARLLLAHHPSTLGHIELTATLYSQVKLSSAYVYLFGSFCTTHHRLTVTANYIIMIHYTTTISAKPASQPA